MLALDLVSLMDRQDEQVNLDQSYTTLHTVQVYEVSEQSKGQDRQRWARKATGRLRLPILVQVSHDNRVAAAHKIRSCLPPQLQG